MRLSLMPCRFNALCAGIPRANKAISAENPMGSPNSPQDKTVVQQHVAFWDRDNVRAARMLADASPAHVSCCCGMVRRGCVVFVRPPHCWLLLTACVPSLANAGRHYLAARYVHRLQVRDDACAGSLRSFIPAASVALGNRTGAGRARSHLPAAPVLRPRAAHAGASASAASSLS